MNHYCLIWLARKAMAVSEKRGSVDVNFQLILFSIKAFTSVINDKELNWHRGIYWYVTWKVKSILRSFIHLLC